MKRHYPQIALALGLLLALVLYQFAGPGVQGDDRMPLLTALFVSEFGFLITAGAAAYCGLEMRKSGADPLAIGQLAGNLLLALAFAYLGIALWTGQVAIPR